MSGGCERCTGHPIGPHLKTCGCPCAPEGCKHAASWAVQDRVSEAQRRLRPRFVTRYGEVQELWHPPLVWDAKRHLENRRAILRHSARWWQLEAMRGYTGVVDEDGKTSSDRSREYAANQRWLVELLDNGVDIDRPCHVLLKERACRAHRQRSSARSRR